MNEEVSRDFVADTVDFVASVYGAKATRSTFNKIDRVEFNFVASVYRALGLLWQLLQTAVGTLL